jgi:hypothetical protein
MPYGIVGICIAMLGACHYNAHAIHRPAWKQKNQTPPTVEYFVGRGDFSAGGIEKWISLFPES